MYCGINCSTIASTRKQAGSPSADEWIRQLWCIYTMEYYSAIKKNAFESVLMRWMKLEPTIQSEVSQKEKHQYSISSDQSLSCVRLFATPWTAALQASLPITNSRSPPKPVSIDAISDSIQPSHPLSSPSPPAFNLSQHQGLFQWVSSSHQVVKVLEFQLQHQSFQWTPRTDLL